MTPVGRDREPVGPPRLAVWLAGLRLSSDEREFALGDLQEEFVEVVLPAVGRARANRWYWRQALRCLLIRRRPASVPSGDSRSPVDILRRDLWQAWRAIRARPAATLAMTGVLTVGIGLVSAMFALADPFLLRPLPYVRPDDLVTLTLSMSTLDAPLPTLADWQARHDLFARVAAYGSSENLGVRANERGVVIQAVPVSRDFIEVIGGSMATPAEWRRSDELTETPIVLAAAASRRLFGPDDARGRVLESGSEDGHTYRVAGVLPETFLFPSPGFGSVGGLIPLGDVPLVQTRQSLTGQRVPGGTLRLVARVQPAVTPEIIQASLSSARAGGAAALGAGLRVSAIRLSSSMRERLRPLALGALAAGFLILAVCAANIANLLLARGTYRTREFATREALGASSLDLARLVLLELGCLSLMGVAGGLLLAYYAIGLIAAVIPAQYTALGAPAITWRVVWFAGAASGVVLVAGLVPAWAAWRVTSATVFTQTSAAESRTVRAIRFSMVTTQSAVAVVLLVGAVMLLHSYANLLTQDPGFSGATVAVRASYPRNVQGHLRGAEVSATVGRLRHLPGVVDAAASAGPLVERVGMVGASAVTLNGQHVPVYVRSRSVTATFFETTQSRLIAGRLPVPSDHDQGAVVSATFAAACCRGASPIGRKLLNTTLSNNRPLEIVGVIADIYDDAFDRRPPATAFVPLEASATDWWITYLLRVDHPTLTLGGQIEREIMAVDPHAAVGDGSTLHERLMQSVNDRSFATLMLSFFAVAALCVSAAGLVGVVSFSVARRTREIAIRMALGASAAHVRLIITQEAAIAAGIGAAIGFTAGAWLSRTLQSLLYGIKPGDATSIIAAALVMMAVVVAAAWIPARRALRLSPTVALRAE